MKIIEPSYEIIDCPDGEQCLAKLERIARLAYKSEDLIDDGTEPCPSCLGTGAQPMYEACSCSKCDGAKRVRVREPSSHKLIRNILKTSRRADLVTKFLKAHRLEQTEGSDSEPGLDLMGLDEVEEFIRAVVDMTVDDIRDNPPHESVIEHESITVMFTSNRGFTHELVRHRLAAFTQESTRYCNYSKGKFGNHISVIKRVFEKLEEIDEWMEGTGGYEKSYMRLIALGVPPEIARGLLGQDLAAPIIMTADLREWRHVLRLRTSPRAHPDMRKLMEPLLEDLRKRIPIIFDELI